MLSGNLQDQKIEGFLHSSTILKKKVDFLRKYTKKVNVKPTKIYNNKFFLDIPPFTNQSFMIGTKHLFGIIEADCNYRVAEGKICIDGKKNGVSISEKISISPIEDVSLDLEDPLISFEPRHDFLRFLGHLNPKCIINLHVTEEGKITCKVTDVIEYEYIQEGCKISLCNIDSVEIRIRNEEIQFIKDILETSVIFCVFDDFLIIYSYEVESTLAVRIPILL